VASVEIFDKKMKWARCGNCEYEWQVRTNCTPRSCPRCKTNLTTWRKNPKINDGTH
jgi:predicted Zn-ribbon and HTH transcriptional regulator